MKCLIVRRDYDNGMDVALKLRKGLCENLAGYAIQTSIQRGIYMSEQTNVPKTITLVVPSPHSSSCVRLSSIIFLAAG